MNSEEQNISYVKKEEFNKLATEVTIFQETFDKYVEDDKETKRLIFAKFDELGNKMEGYGKVNWHYVIGIIAIVVTLCVFIFTQSNKVASVTQQNATRISLVSRDVYDLRDSVSHIKLLDSRIDEATKHYDEIMHWRLNNLPDLHERLSVAESKLEMYEGSLKDDLTVSHN